MAKNKKNKKLKNKENQNNLNVNQNENENENIKEKKVDIEDYKETEKFSDENHNEIKEEIEKEKQQEQKEIKETKETDVKIEAKALDNRQEVVGKDKEKTKSKSKEENNEDKLDKKNKEEKEIEIETEEENKTKNSNSNLVFNKESEKNIAVYGENYKENNNFFLKNIVEFKNSKENKDKVIAVVENDFYFIKNFNVEETLDYILELLSVNFSKIVDDVDSVISFMGLENVRKVKMKKLSESTLRKVNIASNIILKPDVLFVYENINLNKEEREEDLKNLRKLASRFNFKLIYLTSNKSEIKETEEIIEVK